MAITGLYEYLIKINSVKGMNPGDDAAAILKETANEDRKKSKDKDDKDKEKSKLTGVFTTVYHQKYLER